MFSDLQKKCKNIEFDEKSFKVMLKVRICLCIFNQKNSPLYFTLQNMIRKQSFHRFISWQNNV